jgi:hypothetical protein
MFQEDHGYKETAMLQLSIVAIGESFEFLLKFTT